MNRPTPLKALVGGVICMIVCAWIMISLFVVNPPGTITPNQLTLISGKVTRISDVGIKRGYGTLEIWVEHQPLPFRCFDGPYPGSFDAKVLAMLQLGQPVRLGVVTSELSSPRTNLLQKRSFYPFVSLDIADQPALTLAAYNFWSVKNVDIARWFLPLMFCCGFYMAYVGWDARRGGRATV